MTRSRDASRVAVQASLLEREEEVAAIEAAVDAVTAGSGRVIVVEGHAGIGKTELLRLAQRLARATGVRVLSARGGPLESEFPFGVVRQLFEPELRSMAPRERDGVVGGAAAAGAAALGIDAPLADPDRLDLLRVLHGLYWLCSNLAERGPLLLAVDDAHVADAESLRWLTYMAARVDDLPLLLVVAARPGEPAPATAGLAALASAATATLLRPASLSEQAAALLVRATRGEQAEPEFCHACWKATGGNPFYLGELLLETRTEGIAPVAKHADRVRRLGPRTIASATLVRLASLPPPCARVAQAVTILGLDAEVRQAAALAKVDMDSAEQAADALVAAGILEPRRPLNFTHPVVAAAIYADMPLGARSQAHARAARLLARDGAHVGAVASHLMRAEADADVWVLEQLDSASREALSRGAPSAAANYLRRAVQEAREPRVRAGLLHRLGQAEMAAGEREAVTHLVEAVALTPEPREAAAVAGTLCSALAVAGEYEEAEEVGRKAIGRLEDIEGAEAVWRLEGQLITIGTQVARSAAETYARLPGLLEKAISEGAHAPLLFIAGALQLATGLQRHAQVPELVRRALGEGEPIAEETADSLAVGDALCALALVDRLEEADQLVGVVLADARTRGSVMAYVGPLLWRGWMALRRGDVAAAEVDERAALDLAREHELWLPMPWAAAMLAGALLERGQLDAAVDVIESPQLDLGLTDALAGVAFDVRGRVRLASGRHDEGVVDLEMAGERHEAIGAVNPNIIHWRSHLALALGRDSPRAASLVATELDLSRTAGCQRAIGVALRAQGLLEDPEHGIPTLEQAVAVLRDSVARLEYARTLVALGSTLRRAGSRTRAREPLREALDVADRLGAARVADEARAELASTGARPRRRRFAGPESLTPTERRVADLAAEGLNNREIAQSLFVSRKTVEMHLGNAYRKLDIHTRADLARALGETGAPIASSASSS